MNPTPVTQRRILETWWPLAASWLMMGFELPAVSATMARLAEPEVSLAAYGGIVFPLSLLIEAPIIMLLAASTALSRTRRSYEKLRKFMWVSGGGLTLLHLAIAATPLFDLVVVRLLGAPAEIQEPARLGLLIMTPWTGSIAYRRFQQGVLIRFGRSRTVGVGTLIRLLTNVAVLVGGYLLGKPGIIVGTAAVSAGVLTEALFVGLAVRPVLRNELPTEDPEEKPLTLRGFLDFYVPLASTSVLSLVALPLGSAAMSRMPQPIESLAVWPVVNGLTFTLRSVGFAYNEVVVALLHDSRSARELRRFTFGLAVATSLALLSIAGTPLSRFWFATASGLSTELAAIGGRALWLAVLLPATSVLQSWYQGILVNSGKTRGISEAMGLYLVTTVSLLGAGILWGGATGLYVGLGATLCGYLMQVWWLNRSARNALGRILESSPEPAAVSAR